MISSAGTGLPLDLFRTSTVDTIETRRGLATALAAVFRSLGPSGSGNCVTTTRPGDVIEFLLFIVGGRCIHLANLSGIKNRGVTRLD